MEREDPYSEKNGNFINLVTPEKKKYPSRNINSMTKSDIIRKLKRSPSIFDKNGIQDHSKTNLMRFSKEILLNLYEQCLELEDPMNQEDDFTMTKRKTDEMDWELTPPKKQKLQQFYPDTLDQDDNLNTTTTTTANNKNDNFIDLSDIQDEETLENIGLPAKADDETIARFLQEQTDAEFAQKLSREHETYPKKSPTKKKRPKNVSGLRDPKKPSRKHNHHTQKNHKKRENKKNLSHEEHTIESDEELALKLLKEEEKLFNDQLNHHHQRHPSFPPHIHLNEPPPRRNPFIENENPEASPFSLYDLLNSDFPGIPGLQFNQNRFVSFRPQPSNHSRQPSNNSRSLQFVNRDFNADDYETLLSLDKNNVNTGANKTQISQLPIHEVPELKSGEKAKKCCICLEKMVPGVKVRMLPCLCTFHVDCIDDWLKINKHCPVDKTEIV